MGAQRLCAHGLSRCAAKITRLPRRPLSTAAQHLDDTDAAPCAPKVKQIVAATERRILSLFEDYGSSDYIGEPMSITEHSVQAANAAAKAGEDDLSVLACLLHDVGHLAGLEAGFAPGMDGCGTPEHERVGAELLGALGLPEEVAYLAANHVNAKRYLCATVPDYYERLTEASKTTLRHQGGPMSAAEVTAADSNPLWPTVLRMRGYDEAGKDPHASYTSLRDFLPSLRSALRESIVRQLEAAPPAVTLAGEGRSYPLSAYAPSYVLSSEQHSFWDEHGYLVVRGALPERFDAAALSVMADQTAELPSAPCYPWLLHYERSQHDSHVRICRVENFCKHHNAWGDVARGAVAELVSQAFGEPAVLFKDKINYKGPGGGGFRPHQDATAWVTSELATQHITVRMAIDASDELNGPLQVPARPGTHRAGLYASDAEHHGVLTAEVEEALGPWIDVLVDPGDVLLFHSYLPHRSTTNHSDRWRRSAYLTYNMQREGDFHTAYYRKKLQAFSDGSAGSISINDDFGGDIVPHS